MARDLEDRFGGWSLASDKPLEGAWRNPESGEVALLVLGQSATATSVAPAEVPAPQHLAPITGLPEELTGSLLVLGQSAAAVVVTDAKDNPSSSRAWAVRASRAIS